MLKLQSALTGCFGERFDAAVILVVPAGELYRVDSRCGRFLSNQLTNGCRSVTVAAGGQTVDAFVTGAGANQRLARLIIDQLATEVLERPMHAHPRVISRS